MLILKTNKEIIELISNAKIEKKSIGFVPTMGALHKGHLSLIHKCHQENDLVIVSIFVNPTQFDNINDLKKYPRSIKKDSRLIDTISNDIIIFNPNPEEIYCGNISSKNYTFGGLEFEMEGKYRKGHFDGVGTILELLFNLIKPDNAYFGEKDFQQLQIVKKMVAKSNLEVEVIGCKIKRESDGLAMSSRNALLTKEQRENASLIFKVLSEVKEKVSSNTLDEIYAFVKAKFTSNPYLKLEYFQIADEETLTDVSNLLNAQKTRAFIAVFAGNVRLIDNIKL